MTGTRAPPPLRRHARPETRPATVLHFHQHSSCSLPLLIATWREVGEAWTAWLTFACSGKSSKISSVLIMRVNLNVFLNSSNGTESAIHGLPVSCFAKFIVLSCFWIPLLISTLFARGWRSCCWQTRGLRFDVSSRGTWPRGTFCTRERNPQALANELLLGRTVIARCRWASSTDEQPYWHWTCTCVSLLTSCYVVLFQGCASSCLLTMKLHSQDPPRFRTPTCAWSLESQAEPSKFELENIVLCWFRHFFSFQTRS